MNFFFSASAIRAAGSLSNAAPPLPRLLLAGVPPGDLENRMNMLCQGKRRQLQIRGETSKGNTRVLTYRRNGENILQVGMYLIILSDELQSALTSSRSAI